MLIRVIRTFETEQANSTVRRTLTRTIDTVSVVRRGDRLELPDVGELAIERCVLIGNYPERAATPGQPRVVVTTAPESNGYDEAVRLGWRP